MKGLGASQLKHIVDCVNKVKDGKPNTIITGKNRLGEL